jgi:hypothetical protein
VILGKIRSDSFFEVLGLSDIDNFLIIIKILIDSWLFGKGFYFFFDEIQAL